MSTTAVHNWERGQVASARCQKQLADLLAVGPGAFVPARPSSGAGSPDDVVSSVGVIVAAYLARHGAHLQPEALTPLIRAVRGALS